MKIKIEYIEKDGISIPIITLIQEKHEEQLEPSESKSYQREIKNGNAN